MRFERPEIITLHGIGCRFSTGNWNVDEHTLQKPYCEPAWKPEPLRPAKKPLYKRFFGLCSAYQTSPAATAQVPMPSRVSAVFLLDSQSVWLVTGSGAPLAQRAPKLRARSANAKTSPHVLTK